MDKVTGPDPAARSGASDARRSGGRRSRPRPDERAARAGQTVVWPGVIGGRFKPLTDADVSRIDAAAFELLDSVGIAEAPDSVVQQVTARGGKLTGEGRLTFPRGLVEDAIAGCRRDIVLHGQRPGRELDLSPGRVHVGSGGAAPHIVDLETGRYRSSTLRDLYDAARLVDTLENIHFFSRSLVARDISNPREMDVNTAYACLAGTGKHVAVSASAAAHVDDIADICAAIAGGTERFERQPFLSLNINHVVPPMRFDADACAVMERAALLGIPFFVNTFGQVGASQPASLAGAIAQSMVETLAGMVFAWLVNPRCIAIFGPRPMITDLRTGAMSGGGGEQAVATAGAIQMSNHYGLANSAIAGATDAKIPDAQSGYEKAMTVSLAAHAGCNMITQACGMQASLMGCALESYVIDDDMLGGILRSVRGIEASAENIVADVIADTVRGEGHFLGASDTYQRMETDFLYPSIADRRTPDAWEADGSPDIRQTARDRTRTVLARHFPTHLNREIDAKIRARFNIHLPAHTMRCNDAEGNR